jgi:glycosyltransferase involved in cell wall biosynthesis
MNICSIIYGDRPDKVEGGSGTGITLWKLSTELVRQDCNVYVLHKRGFDSNLPLESEVDGVRFFGVDTPPLSILSRFSFGLSAVKMLRKIENEFDIDVFAFHGACSTANLSSLRKHSDKPIVYHEYGATPLLLKEVYSKVSPPETLLRLTLDSALEYLALRYVDKLIVASPHTKREFQHCYRYPEERIGIVPLGQDIFERHAHKFMIDKKNTKREKQLLFVGNDWHRKGVKHLFLALKEVLDEVSDVTLNITGPPQETFISMAENLNLKNHVKYIGNVDEETLARFYNDCDVFVLPSFHEGFSNTIIEAMAFGKPVITTPIAGYPVIENGKEGFTVSPGDFKTLASLIIRLLNDEVIYQEMSKNATEKAKKYTWRESAKNIMNEKDYHG